MAAAAEEAKKVTLRTLDGELFEVEEATAMMAQSIKHMIEDDCAKDCIPVPNVTGKILSKVLEYARKHADTAAGEEELKVWDADYIKVDMDTLYFLTLAANFLNVKGLLELCCQTVADLIKGKSVEEIRRTFNIQNDFTPDEEEEIRREHAWAFE